MDNFKVTETNTKETDDTKNESINPKDYKVIMELIQEMDESYKVLRESTISTLESYGLEESALEGVLPYKKEELDDLDVEVMRNVLNENSLEGGFIINDVSDDDVRSIFNIVKDESLALIGAKLELEETKAETNDILKDYFNYISSDRVRKSREERLATLKAAAENEPDGTAEKRKILNMINTIENSLNFAFVQDRFNKFGSKEVESIVNSFFDDTKSSYIMERFLNRITKFGYNEEVIRSFYNIEENFLSKEFSPFNNLFLFWYIKFVAYADPNNKNDIMLVQSLTSAMANLVYHKFNSTESEVEFIGIVSSVDEKFFDYVDIFKEKNETYENHPKRIAAMKEHEKNRRAALIKSLHRLNASDFDENMDIEEMQKLFSDLAEKMIDEQIVSKQNDEEYDDENEDEV